MKGAVLETKEDVVILFAGDSGDGIQLTGGQFTETVELYGNDISTFPNYPADIRAPQGTLSGVSGFQLKFGSNQVFTPGDKYDALVVMNAAALKVNLKNLKPRGIILANSNGFDGKNLKLAGYETNPLEDGTLDAFDVHSIEVTKITRNALKETGLGMRDIDRCKNMFVLGFILWIYNRSLENTEKFIKEKFQKKPDVVDANILALKAGYHFGDTSETFTTRFEVKPAPMEKGVYRNINGNTAIAIGLVSAAEKAGLDLFYGSYPITPASEILQELARLKNFGVRTFQAEDEIAAACGALGASFGGSLGATASSGPGLALKAETMGLAVMLELPLVIVNVQRGGPSTGLPTKTEQADLFQAFYGRSGEAPLVVLAAKTPSDCFDAVFEASRIALEHMTPVVLLSDGYISNGSEPWMYPKAADLPEIKPPRVKDNGKTNGQFLPYTRDNNLVRPWAIPGMEGYAHRIGGLEKEKDTGNVSYDPENHEYMVNLRQEKIDKIMDFIPDQEINRGKDKGKMLVLGWGSTYGAIETAVRDLNEDGYSVSHCHLRYLNPMPKNLEKILGNFEKVLIPEMNLGQLRTIIRGKYMIDAEGLNKVQGMPFTVDEIKEAVIQRLK